MIYKKKNKNRRQSKTAQLRLLYVPIANVMANVTENDFPLRKRKKK